MPALTEINVTDPPSHLLPVDPATPTVDQTSKLKAIIEYVANSADGGGVVYIPAGKYLISGNLITRDNQTSSFTIRGDGAGATKLVLDNEATPGSIPAIFAFRSTTGNPTCDWFTIKDLSCEHPASPTGTANHSWFYFERTFFVRMERVEVRGCKKYGIYGKEWRDSVCHDVHLDLCGSASTQFASMKIESGDNPSRNLKFEACRWEGNPYHGCEIKNAIGTSFLGCKWHGQLPSGGGSLPPYNHLVLDGAHATSLAACRFSNSGLDLIRCNNASSVMIVSSVFDNADAGAAVRVIDSKQMLISGNFFAQTAVNFSAKQCRYNVRLEGINLGVEVSNNTGTDV